MKINYDKSNMLLNEVQDEEVAQLDEVLPFA
jgi:hypothetical protein